ncbi:MAG: hypothetical protein JSS22_20575 [Proteobacteria bacterium]|nr:hypothetical protein [Pseudomonadota bacterium]
MIAYLKGVRFYNDVLRDKAPKAELVKILTKNTTAKNAALYEDGLSRAKPQWHEGAER